MHNKQEWEECIYKMANKTQLCDKYMDIFEELVQEIKTQYYETIRDIAMRQIIAVKYEVACPEDLVVILPYKYPDRTEFITKFLRNRCKFAKQYYLSHRFIKNIVAKAQLLLPEKFCDLGRYRSFVFLDPDRLFESIRTDLKKSTHVITSYYSDIIRSVFQRRYIQDVPPNILGRFVTCATSLLGLQIISRTINTIDHLLIILGDQTKIPLLKVCYKNTTVLLNICRTLLK
ncbi:hypothetical protein X777_08540 [Ooceraea biroi]|uniref:Uncharacterized protein n=1 Tax=Ooceraea biroi TaxID=2015173 RepID=A0A026WC89_OOCBI|nr:hypothetical protein X777_08540 [Ooceraea biroi]